MEFDELMEKLKGLTSFVHEDWQHSRFVFHCKCGETMALEIPERAAEEWRIWNKAQNLPE